LKKSRWPLIVFLGMAALALVHGVKALDTHTVIKVFDGDTIQTDDGRKIRLIGIDAPEVNSPYTLAEPFGEESKVYLTRFLLGQKVRVVPGKEPFDVYGRSLAYVYRGDILINGRIVRDGYARAYTRFDYPEKELFLTYEREAKARGLGLWKDIRSGPPTP
jgi:micrococcal nuclease